MIEAFGQAPGAEVAVGAREGKLVEELAAAGFASTGWRPTPMRLRYSRQEAAHLLRERFASSLAHISDAELETGARRAERELPPFIEPVLEMVLVLAR